MLINDLEYFKTSANYCNTTSGIDHPDEIIYIEEKPLWYEYPIQDFDYQFNSWGFRGPEYEHYIGKKVNICLGDSFTVNVGGPIEHSWCSQLAKHFDIPTLNLGMDGAGNDAIRLVYDRACELFDVQNTFVMYSFLHRRLNNKNFIIIVEKDSENFKYFLEQRIINVFECALPVWCWTDEEKQFLYELKIFFLDIAKELYFSNNQTIDRKFIHKGSYNRLRGKDWPDFDQFIQGAETHPDMLTEEFSGFISYAMYTNRDRYHLNQETNKIYADYFYNQWKKRNES